VIEVHSGIFQTQAVSWSDYDPADVWYEVLTNLLAIPPERIGLGSLPRGGRPPKVTDIAPGDATTQAKRKVTVRTLREEVEGDKVLDSHFGDSGWRDDRVARARSFSCSYPSC
jgi:hypothetical protein